MEQVQSVDNDLKLQIIQSTSIYNKKLNKNNAIDTTNIIYLAGASIVFHNIFQNSKKFIKRISDAHILGMTFYKSSDNILALITRSCVKTQQQQQHQYSSKHIIIECKKSAKFNIQLYSLGEEGSLLCEITQDIQFIDMELYDKKRLILLAKQSQKYYFYFIQNGKKLIKKLVNMPNPKKFISQDRKISLLGQFGMRQVDLQFSSLSSQNKFQNLSIDDYSLVDNQFQVILSDNRLYCYHQEALVDQIYLEHFNDNKAFDAHSVIRVGRNLLIGHKNAITLSHFVIEHNAFKFLNNYTYKQKIKGGIIGMQVSFDEMHLSLSVDIIEKDVSRIQNFMFNLSILSSDKKFINPFIRLAALGSQSSEITCLQGIIPNQTYYLSGNTIINYSFGDQIQKRFKFSLHQTPKQLVVHPLGHQFVCIFQNQIKFYLKIENQLIQIWNQQIICSSAKYMNCGLLLLSRFQDNFYQIVLYDSNSFQKVRNIPNILLKHAVTKIQLAEQDSQIILYVGHDLFIYKIKTSQKIAQFKQKRQKQEILSLAYEPSLMNLISSTCNKTLLYSKKMQDSQFDFKFQKIIQLQQQVTCIEINANMGTVFMGTKSGKLLWTQYPLELTQTEQHRYSIPLKQIRLSFKPINQIFLTSNRKFLFVSFKQEGMAICKLKKLLKQVNNRNRFDQFDISNLNFLQTSSKYSLEAGQQKLKTLLQKRKTVFNDLDEYKKEWQTKKYLRINKLDQSNKHRQLQHIKSALQQVQRLKQQKSNCFIQLNRIQQETKHFLQQKQQKYQRQILLFYEDNVKLRSKKQMVIQKCQKQYQMVQSKCKANIQDIQIELKSKYDLFMQNYQEMKNNMNLFQKRLQIQKQQAEQILSQLFDAKSKKLNQQDLLQNKKSNELKAQITRLKKQSQRFTNRKYFLQSKRNFFNQQLNFCKTQKVQLLQIKQELEEQLKQLELLTNKKEKRLRKYFKENQILTKYQSIHTNLINDLNHQKLNTNKNIVSIQKELSSVAETNELYQLKIAQYKAQILRTKNRKHKSSQQLRYLTHTIRQLSQAIENTKGDLNDQNKAILFGGIYKQFYIERKLEKLIKSSQLFDPSRTQADLEFKIFNTAQNKKQMVQSMKKHKEYLQKNMNLFQRHNKKTDEQMNLNYLKYQTQNYNLIAQCNVRKEQTNKKKRVLHQLIDNVKEAQMYMNRLQKENVDQGYLIKQASQPKLNSQVSIPFIQYKKNKQQIEKSRFKVLRKQQSQSNLWKSKKSVYQVRRMLQVQKVNRPGSSNRLQRKIQTASMKGHPDCYKIQQTEFVQTIPSGHKKPMTATGKRHQAPFGQYYVYNGIKNKASSKPTTCTTHTNGIIKHFSIIQGAKFV